MQALGHIGNLPRYPSAIQHRPIRRQEANDSRIDFELIQGLAYTQSFQCFKYNYATGKGEPVDLTGANLRFTVYKPQYALQMDATQDATGRKVTRTVTLDGEEFLQMQALSQEKKGAYLSSLPKVQAAYSEFIEEIGSVEKLEPKNQG